MPAKAASCAPPVAAVAADAVHEYDQIAAAVAREVDGERGRAGDAMQMCRFMAS